MAIDTKRERYAIAGLKPPFPAFLPVADSSIAVEDRLQLICCYYFSAPVPAGAVTTAQKRFSLIGLGLAAPSVLPQPDSTFDEDEDRRQLTYQYAFDLAPSQAIRQDIIVGDGAIARKKRAPRDYSQSNVVIITTSQYKIL